MHLRMERCLSRKGQRYYSAAYLTKTPPAILALGAMSFESVSDKAKSSKSDWKCPEIKEEPDSVECISKKMLIIKLFSAGLIIVCYYILRKDWCKI